MKSLIQLVLILAGIFCVIFGMGDLYYITAHHPAEPYIPYMFLAGVIFVALGISA